MPRGKPDYSNPDYKTSVANIDFGALLIALRGVGSVDNRGRIWFFDTFAEGLYGWAAKTRGDGTTPCMHTLHAEIAPASVQLVSGTLATGGWSYLERTFTLNGVTRIGIEAGVCLYNTAGDYSIDVVYKDGSVGYSPEILVSAYRQTIEVVHAGGTDIVASLGNISSDEKWMPVKYVVDLATKKFVSLTYGQISIDLSQYSILSFSSSYDDLFTVTVRGVAVTGIPRSSYLGHVILTLDEP